MIGVELKYTATVMAPYIMSVLLQGVTQPDIRNTFFDYGVLGAVTVICMYAIRGTTKEIKRLNEERAIDARKSNEARIADAKEYAEKLESIVSRLGDMYRNDTELKVRLIDAFESLSGKRLNIDGPRDSRRRD